MSQTTPDPSNPEPTTVSVPDQPAPSAWIEDALAAAVDLPGADAGCVVIIRDATSANLRWANNALTTNGQMHTRTAQVVALATVDGGVASGCLDAPVTSSDEVVALVRRAAELAASGTPDEDAAPLVDGGVDPDMADPPASAGIEAFTGLAQGLGRSFTEAGDHHLFFGFAELAVTTIWLGTSAGTRRRAVERMGRLELNAKHPDLIGSAWVGRSTPDFADIDIAALTAEVLERLSWCENRVELPAGRYETILPGGALADLLIYAYWTMAGRDAREGSTVFSGPGGGTRVGERLATLPITMWSDPRAPRLERAPFAVTGTSLAGLASVHDNGVPVGRQTWLEEGRLATLVETRAELAAMGSPDGADHPGGDQDRPLPWPTENLLVDAGGTATLDEMVRSTKRGLLLTCLWYIREVDPETLLLTGLTRDGVYLVEDGKVTGMVNNFRWNESPVDLLKRITEVGRSEQVLCREWNDWFTLTQVPPVRVPEFNMSTVSKAY
ncbi:metallopeptidase TldD-related protein [Aestuariimicrobium kwangyangense]|uniref:metallopeptidase TldD-related protein n=1 Tax=Aestuariimicrobium kwangyangense TaxID=396389 RepID=UPI0003B44084|nr:metallopeptidase TldD-related protein [Aestuariimicrobium kwangyangense]